MNINEELEKLHKAYSSERLEELKKTLPRDADVLIAIAERINKEFQFLVEASIIEGVSGNIDQAIHYHKLSFQCLQINGMLMEHARDEGSMEYYMDARKKKVA